MIVHGWAGPWQTVDSALAWPLGGSCFKLQLPRRVVAASHLFSYPRWTTVYPRWAVDDRVTEDDDEAAQAILPQQVGVKEASGNPSAWGGGPAADEDTDEDEELWDDEAADQNENEDTDPTSDRDGNQWGVDSDKEVGRTNVDRTLPLPALCSRPGAGVTSSLDAGFPNIEKDLMQVIAVVVKQHLTPGDAEMMNWQLIRNARNPALQESALASLPTDLCGLKQLGMLITRKPVKVVSEKAAQAVALVPMISLLDIACFWEHHLELSKFICNAARDTNRQLPTVCASTTEKMVPEWWERTRRLMGSDAKVVAIIEASLTSLIAPAAKVTYRMRSNCTCHVLMSVFTLDDPQLNQLGLHIWLRILEGHLILLAKDVQMWFEARGGKVLLIGMLNGIVSDGLCRTKDQPKMPCVAAATCAPVAAVWRVGCGPVEDGLRVQQDGAPVRKGAAKPANKTNLQFVRIRGGKERCLGMAFMADPDGR
ncbi:hypothetical protein BDK51DRAFT_40225 [Blyttiomyces helicus]|uniref:Uncharacterized protein n=1 Tax=Blyttiomyces helicus TaxID=388810 RepID=A0A4P9WFB6_9FUNG|nr:hypothetical protein BDK51DRAFT_40225 [Blyttiomyces helicus]|eukprot:RKO89998.1 hypothetical protein BDK51DRAFT_40225 [Blyttiomyces helicus]